MSSNSGYEELVTRQQHIDKYGSMQNLVERVNKSEIASIRQSVNAIVKVINNPRSTVKELKEVIRMDPPLTGRVLKTANSPYYTRIYHRSFSDIEQAIVWMGSEKVRELALHQKVCEIFDKEKRVEEYSRKALWRHSIAVATMAKAIYRKQFAWRGENAYVAGLLHDIGIIGEDQFLQQEFNSIVHLTIDKSIDLSTSEEKILGFNHAEVGGAICSSWGLPEELIASIGCHHSPGRAAIRFSRLAAALYISDYMCQINDYGFGITRLQNTEYLNECLRVTEIKANALDLIFKHAKQELTKMEEKGLLRRL
jgi:putative nucleotidyltransferase with HDIG domain